MRDCLSNTKSSNLHNQLPLIRTIEQLIDRSRSLFQTFDHIDAILYLALHQPAAEFRHRFLCAIHVVGNQKALHARALYDQHREVVRPGRRLGRVVLRDQSAYRNARSDVYLREHGIEYRATHILEVNINTLWTSPLQCLGHVFGFVVDRCIEAQLLCQPAALVIRARDANYAQAFDLPNLADERTNRARSSRHHQRLTGFRLAHVEQSVVSSQPDVSKQSHVSGQWNRGIVRQLRKPRAVRNRVLLPAKQARNMVAGFEVRVARFFDTTDRAAAHYVPQFDGGQIGVTFGPAAIRGIKRDVLIMNEHLTLL